MIATVEIHTKTNICTTLYTYTLYTIELTRFWSQNELWAHTQILKYSDTRNISKSRQTLDLKL